MILLLLIILFIIFLLYRFRQRTVEEYIIDSVDLSWRNKTGVEDVVNKWILVVKDKNNNEIHRTENSDSNNRKNETDVKLNVFSNKTFGDNIIGNNTIDIYYNEVSDDKKVNTQLLRFEKDEFTENLGSFEFRDLDMSAWENAQNKDCEGIYSKVKKNKSTLGVEKFGCGPANDPNKHWCQFWKHTHTQKQLGTGKACSRGDGHVIKVQWPKKTNTDRVGLQFVDDPNPNTDSKVDDNPQYYKSLFDQQQAIINEQEKENARIAKEAADKAAAEALGGVIPNQTKLGDDGFCIHGGVVIHQVDGDVNTAKGCKRICSDTNNVWTRDTSHGTWDSNEANRIVEECTDAKLDIIWEKDGDGKRKLRSGFKASKDYVPPQNQYQPAVNINTDGFKWFVYDKHFKNKSEFSGQTPSRSGEGITDLSWKNIIKELGISGTPGDQKEVARQRITGGVAGDYGSEYSIHFTGTYIPQKTGTYEFQTTSDDMSFLYIDDELIVDNGGLHWFVEKQGKKTLTSGKVYKIDIYFSEKGGDDGIDVEIKRPGDGNWSHIFDFTSLKNVRYVWFGYENSDWKRPLNISQIEVYSGGVNIVKDFGDDAVDQSSFYADWTSPKRLFDGTLTTMAHTKDGKTNWFRIDLGKEYSVIDKVMVYNRMNPWWCCRDRWAGSFVKLLDSNKKLIVRSKETLPTDKTKAKNYTEDPDGAGETYLKTFTFNV